MKKRKKIEMTVNKKGKNQAKLQSNRAEKKRKQKNNYTKIIFCVMSICIIRVQRVEKRTKEKIRESTSMAKEKRNDERLI